MSNKPENVFTIDHPLVHCHLSRLRHRDTDPPEFRRLVRSLTSLLVYEATQDLKLEPWEVETPISECEGAQLAGEMGIVPILRAGLGMVEPVLELLPTAQVWHLGLYRDEETAEPVTYYSKLPPERAVDEAIILDPMLATGGSVAVALETLQKWGVSRVKILGLIGSAEGVSRIAADFPNVQIFLCQIDPILNDQKFIVPGLGDAGDRIFNTEG